MWTGNVGLLNVVRKRIIDNAARFNMLYYGQAIFDDMKDVIERPACNTQACIAGETLLETGQAELRPGAGGFAYHLEFFQDPETAAANSLGLTQREAERLFGFRSWTNSIDGWPEQFEAEYNEAKTPAARAEVASRRILHFIVTEGRE